MVTARELCAATESDWVNIIAIIALSVSILGFKATKSHRKKARNCVATYYTKYLGVSTRSLILARIYHLRISGLKDTIRLSLVHR